VRQQPPLKELEANKVDEFGLIAHWKMDELDGNNLLDSTRNSHTGTINGPTRSSGFEGGALTFDGIDDSVTFGSGPALGGTSDFTLSAWVKTTATTDQVVIQQRNGGFNGQYQLRVRETGAVSFYVYGNLATQFDFRTNLSVNDGEWHHIVAVRDGENGYIYIDGDPTPAASAIGTLRDLDSSIGVGIGRDIRDNIRPFSGQIDEVKIYSLAKSGTEIQQAYNQYLNQAPSWKTEPLMIPDAIEGVSYTTNLNESATDPNGDPLTFSYLNGPSWLSIAPTGELSGTPSREDAGQQSWTVSVSDGVNPAVETIIYLTVLADTDGDGIPDSIDLDDDNDEIPDAWEIQYGLNPLLADANDNPDGDRYNNLTEYLFDTNPLEASSEQVLRVEAGDALGSLQLRYQSSADRVYTLETSSDLENGIWQRFTEPSPGTDSEVFVPIVPSDDKRFFRLRVELP
ncbi:MAG: LamG-like jellyroll fold domain-containing protein, partial [Luteolibacter sp.]